jgi:hypothetical protein
VTIVVQYKIWLCSKRIRSKKGGKKTGIMHAVTSAEDEKIRKYHDACESKGGSFSPFVTSADGVLAPQATKFPETLATRLTEKQNSL